MLACCSLQGSHRKGFSPGSGACLRVKRGPAWRRSRTPASGRTDTSDTSDTSDTRQHIRGRFHTAASAQMISRDDGLPRTPTLLIPAQGAVALRKHVTHLPSLDTRATRLSVSPPAPPRIHALGSTATRLSAGAQAPAQGFDARFPQTVRPHEPRISQWESLPKRRKNWSAPTLTTGHATARPVIWQEDEELNIAGHWH